MSLTLPHGPLSKQPARANYRIDGPGHRLFFESFPRRVRATFAGETVLDTRRGSLLHETGLLPQLYVPQQDVRTDLLTGTDTHTRCPFKGDASYWSVCVGARSADDAAWAYADPLDGVEWLRGHVAFYWGAMDAWYDEDEQVHAHLRDPYHRVDVRDSSSRVRVSAFGELIADTRRPKVLSETGLPNRLYIPPEDVRQQYLEASAKRTACPYKGAAAYRTIRVGDKRLEDAAWVYDEPLENALKVRGHLCFLAEGVDVAADDAD
ncbi:MAG: DUF427 domain-containing protein [Gammaproteobacteria bacterium]|nr:DUF427 domain-containing protein [Gammaproteobacteria bacterium]